MNMLKNKKKMTFEEVELIVEEISELEKEISKLQDNHIEIMLGNIFFDTIEQKNTALEVIELNIDFLIDEIKELKGGQII